MRGKTTFERVLVFATEDAYHIPIAVTARELIDDDRRLGAPLAMLDDKLLFANVDVTSRAPENKESDPTGAAIWV